MTRRLDAATVLLVAVVVVGVLMRLHNLTHYPLLWGFDASENWAYVKRLLESWRLPAPDEGWATSHPPLFYYLAAGLVRLLGRPRPEVAITAIRLVVTTAGLASVALGVALVRNVAPHDRLRMALAAGALLFLPAHVMMSAMLSEELLAAAFVSLALVGACWTLSRPATSSPRWLAPIGIGIAAGLANLTKLSGVLVVVAIVGAYALEGLRRGAPRRAAVRVAAVGLAAALVAGWFYAHDWWRYGYLYPQDLARHRIMKTMPPGERGVRDYLTLPMATWTDPQVLDPDLLHSVWGSTFATVWFDGHRHFLPRDDAATRHAGTALLLLALLPTAAFLAGMGRGLRRWLREPGGPDGPLLLLVGLTLAGYVAFTWRNPWFATVKGSYLLGLSVPFAFYTSEALARWMRAGRVRGWLLGAPTIALAIGVAALFSFGLVVEKAELPGLPWRPDLQLRSPTP